VKGANAGPVGIHVEGEGENGRCRHKAQSIATSDKKTFFHRMHLGE
jgi:hypothetical protein